MCFKFSWAHTLHTVLQSCTLSLPPPACDLFCGLKSGILQFQFFWLSLASAFVRSGL